MQRKENRTYRKTGKACIILKLNLIRKFNYTSAGIRTRVRALATPGDDRYTTDVLMVPRPGFEPGTTASSGQRSPTELPGQTDKFTIYVEC